MSDAAARRPVWMAVPLLAGAAACCALLWPVHPILLWNVSPSSPTGLYAISRPARPRRGEMVVAWAPQSARELAARRHYLPSTVPLVKRVAAVAGDRVCAARRRIFLNGRPVALRRMHDPAGRPMPLWSGCRVLRPGELFLLSRHAPLAFDGRYFGFTHSDGLVGEARLLWAS